MRWPRKGILIRLAIYIPVIGFLGYNAWLKYQARSAAEEAATSPAPDPAKQELERHKRVYTMPDGSKQDVYELTPEEAERLLGKPVAMPEGKQAPAAEDAEAAPGDPDGATADAKPAD